MKRRNVPVFLLFAVLLPLFPLAVFPQAGEVKEKTPEMAAPGYERSVEMVELENAAPDEIEAALKAFTRQWQLFPSLQFLASPAPSAGRKLLFLRGYADEVALARKIAEYLDGFYPAPSARLALSRLPLEHVAAPEMRKKLLALSAVADLGWTPDRFLVFPSGSGGSLFFRGSGPEADEVREVKEELDQPRYSTALDLLAGFWRGFRRDFSTHFLTVTTYVVSALLLLLLHFLLVKTPWLGKRYERFFTLIWTKVLDNIKGRDFAFEVIKSIAETAVESAEQSTRAGEEGGLRAAGEGGKKVRALAIARGLLVYRGFNPDDPQVKRVVEDLIEAKVYKLSQP